MGICQIPTSILIKSKNAEVDKVSKQEEERDMQVTVKQLDLSKYTGLTKEKKAILKEHMGSVSFKIDTSAVREWWKYENN